MRPELDEPRGWSAGKWAIGALVLLCLTLVLTWLGGLIAAQFTRHAVTAWILLPVALAVVVFSLLWIWQEVSRWRRLVRVDHVRPVLSGGDGASGDRERFIGAVHRFAGTLDRDRAAAVTAFLRHYDDGDRPVEELREFFAKDIVDPLDRVALVAVRGAVQQIFFLAAISPNLLVDAVSFSVRATALIRAIAAAYGHRPGKIGTYRLTKHVIADVALLSGLMLIASGASRTIGNLVKRTAPAAGAVVGGLVDTAAHGATIGMATTAGAAVGREMGQIAGDTIADAGEELADASAAAIRMAQLGLLAIAVIRPVSLSDDCRVSLRRELLAMIVSLKRGSRDAAQPDAGPRRSAPSPREA